MQLAAAEPDGMSLAGDMATFPYRFTSPERHARKIENRVGAYNVGLRCFFSLGTTAGIIQQQG